MSSYLLAFAGFAALIILHEAGHFVAAKAVGMRVERFMLFFPPAAFIVRRGETEYGVGLIPLGGYVRITGMNPHEEVPPDVAHRAYYRQKVWKRIVVIAAGPTVNVVLAFAILTGLFIAEGKPVPRVGVFQVQPGTAAASALHEGDLILSIDKVPGYAPHQTSDEFDTRAAALRSAINRHRCAGRPVGGCVAATPARIELRRHGRTIIRDVRPRYDSGARRMILGFQFGGRQDVGIGEAANLSVTGMWRVTKLTVDHIVQLFYSSKARDQVSGVVGSYEATRESFQFDTVQAVQFLALISLSLGIINLFPFLPLDGGHIFWAAAEKVRGRAIPYAVMERASIIGFLLIIFLFFIGLQNDIGRLSSGEGFGVR